MTEDRSALIAFLRSRRAEHIRYTRLLIASAAPQAGAAGGREITDDELDQMFDGFLRVLDEALEGERTDVFDFYTSVVFPGLVAAGNPIEDLVSSVMSWLVLMVADIEAHFEARDPQALRVALAAFVGRYCRRMIESGREVRA